MTSHNDLPTSGELREEMRNRIASLEAENATLKRERDEALDRIDELEREAGDVASEFEKELTGAVWALLRRLDADLSEGMTAGGAVEWLDLHIREINETALRQLAEFKQEAAEVVGPFAGWPVLGNYADTSFVDCTFRAGTLRRARTFLDTLQTKDDTMGEREYWKSVGIDPCVIAAFLYAAYPNRDRALLVINNIMRGSLFEKEQLT